MAVTPNKRMTSLTTAYDVSHEHVTLIDGSDDEISRVDLINEFHRSVVRVTVDEQVVTDGVVGNSDG